MNTFKTDVLIIGGGLTGLTLAYLLEQSSINYTLIEARERLGGRIHTKYNNTNTPIELGATWLIEQQTSALKLLQTLNIEVFEQHYSKTAIYHPNGVQNAQLVNLPQNDTKSFRIKNGTYTLIKILAHSIDKNSIKLNEAVKSLKLNENQISVTTESSTYQSKYVVSTLPPLLLQKTIQIKPTLPENIITLLSKTHTWMHNSIRAGLTYKTPFWKANKTSGTIYTSTGPIQEFYDHTNAEEDTFALSGFINSNFIKYTKEERKQLILQQLKSYYGDIALDFINYEECIWENEEYTTTKSDSFLMPQTNNGHPLFQTELLENRFFIAGAETSSVFSGKMEGAITSANLVYEKLKGLL